MLQIIKNFINFVVLFVLSIINFFIIIKNIKKIKHNIIIVQNRGGFGNTFEICDLARYILKSNFLFILFYDQSRHNPYLPSLFTTKCIILKSTIKINFFGKYIYLGIKERDESNKDYDLLTELLIGFIRIISKKIFKNDYLRKKTIYNFSKKFGHQKFDLMQKKDSQWKGLYYHLAKTKRKKLFFSSLEKKMTFKQVSFFKKLKKTKNICIYLRNRKNLTDKSNYLRDGSKSKEYIKMINYLLDRNYNVLLSGDKVFNHKQLENFNTSYKNKVYDIHNFSENDKCIFRLMFVSLGKTYISESGGANYFGLYVKNSLHINTFPFCESLTSSKFILKEVIDTKKNIRLSKAKIKKLFYHNFKLDKYKLLPNSSEQLYKFIKKNVN